MKHSIIRGLLFWLLVLVLAVYFGRVVSLKQTAITDAECTTLTIVGLDAEPAYSLDVLSIGPSTSYTTLLPKLIWDTQGIPAYTLGTPYQDARTGYYVLRYALRRQKPKMLLISASYLFSETKRTYQEPFVLMISVAMQPSAAKFAMMMDYMRTFETISPAALALPLLQYHTRVGELTLADFTLRDFHQPHPLKGSMIFTGQNTKPLDLTWLPDSDQSAAIDPTSAAYTAKILALCEENSIDVLFVAPPKVGRWTQEHHELAADFCREHGAAFLDYNTESVVRETGLDPLTDYMDAAVHTNYSGQRKLSLYLGRYLAEAFALPDHRGEAAYAAWDQLTLPGELQP